MFKKRIAEKKDTSPKERELETTAVVQGVTVETLECDDGMLIRSLFGFVSELTTRGTTPPLSPISGSSVEQCGHKKVHCTERGSNTSACSGDYHPSRQPSPLLQSSGVSLLNDQTRSGCKKTGELGSRANRL